jgi:lysophospholipase L1-like esterase
MNPRNIPLVAGSLLLLAAAAAVPRHKVYVVGDSTSCVYASNLAPRTGWGQVLQALFQADSVEVVDKALSGRSSKSFYTEKNWDPIKSALRQGDYVIIAFGHNDEKTDDATRGTLPGSTFEQYLSIYIDDAKAKGAIPLLVTPIERNGWSSATTVKASHGLYPQAIRDLAKKKGIGLVDLTVLTTALYQKLGKDATTNTVFLNLPAGAYANYPNGVTDNTHLQLRGANEIAKLLAADIAKQKLPAISSWLVGSVVGVDRNGLGLRRSAHGGHGGVDALGRSRDRRFAGEGASGRFVPQYGTPVERKDSP